MKVVSLFSGAGGLDLGFIKAGHKVIWANDYDKDAVDTYRSNIGEKIIHGNIKDIKSDDIPDCDMVIGGFPCQGFSVANMKRHDMDSRNLLYLEFLRIIKDKKPHYFLAENVKGLISFCKGDFLKRIIEDFASEGYSVKYKVLNAADYGVPQSRQRVFIIGVKNELQQDIEYPAPTHINPSANPVPPMKAWISVGEALADIPEPEEANLPNHVYSKYKLRFNGYLGHRKIDPNKPAPTVTGRGDNKGGVVVIHHPKNHRRMSARELATVQSFPLDYEFSGPLSTAYRLIANAVPPLMAENLAYSFPL